MPCDDVNVDSTAESTAAVPVSEANLRWLRQVAGRLLRCPSDADEITQRVLIAAWRRNEAVGREWMRRALRREAGRLIHKDQQERKIIQEWSVTYSPLATYAPRASIADASPAERAAYVEGGARDAARGQQVMDLRRRGARCKNGHIRDGNNTRYARDGTVVCLACCRIRAAATRRR